MVVRNAEEFPKDKIRVQLDVSPEELETIETMLKVCNIATRRDLFNNAMTLFKWAVDEVRKGNIITSYNVDANQYVELRMPTLSHAAKYKGAKTPGKVRARA